MQQFTKETKLKFKKVQKEIFNVIFYETNLHLKYENLSLKAEITIGLRFMRSYI